MNNIMVYISRIKHTNFILRFCLVNTIGIIICFCGDLLLLKYGLNVYLGLFEILALFITMFYIGSIGYKIYEYFQIKPYLIINDEGLTCNAWGQLVLPWEEIIFVNLHYGVKSGENFMNIRNMEITLKQHNIHRLKIPIGRSILIRFMHILGYKYQILINLNSIDSDPEDIVNAIKYHLNSLTR